MARDVSGSLVRCAYGKAYMHICVVLVGDDNPAWDGLFEFCSLSAGGSIGMFDSNERVWEYILIGYRGSSTAHIRSS